MSDNNGVRESLSRIENKIGKIEGKVDSIDERVDRVENNLELIRESCIELGKSTAVLNVDGTRREKRISTLERSLRAVENTGQTFIIKQQATWKVIATIFGATIGSVGLIELIFKVLHRS